MGAEKEKTKHNLGEHVRRLRLAKHMSLGDLAVQVNTSRSFLSQVEQGKTMPSVSTLKSIASALNVTVGSLIDEPSDLACPIVRSDNRPKMEHLQSGIMFEALTWRDVHKMMEPILITLQAKASSGHDTYTHRGQEFGIVLKGKLRVEVDGVTHELGTGDSIYFDSSRPHRFTNVGKDEVVALWVISPPTF